MKTIIFIVILITSGKAMAQTSEKVMVKKETVENVAAENEATMAFRNDVKLKRVKIYLLGGIVSVIQKDDHAFEKQYGIQYHDFGCVVPANLDYYKRYNALAYNYLTEKSGAGWKAAINTNAVGWKK